MLGSGGWSGDIRIAITDAQWSELLGAYGQALNDDQKAELEKICNSYFIWRMAEKHDISVAEVKENLEQVRKDFEPFAHACWAGWKRPATDKFKVAWELGELIDFHLPALPIPVQGESIEVLNPASNKWEPSGLSGKYAIRLDPVVMHDFVNALHVAFTRAQADVDAQMADTTSGFQSGQAFKNWLISMKDWAKLHGLQRGPFLNAAQGNNVPSPFSTFLFQLHRLFPADLQETVTSPEAMGHRLKEAAKRLPA